MNKMDCRGLSEITPDFPVETDIDPFYPLPTVLAGA